jgi:capsid portal protein
MGKNTNKTHEYKFCAYDSPVKVVPTFIERDYGKTYLNYGLDNRFPNYLWDLYLRSALLQSIINGTADYTFGNGAVYSPNQLVQKLTEEANKDGETLDDIMKKIVIDYLIFGGFALQVIYNKLGEINEIYWLDFRNCRRDKDETKIYYSSDWIRHSQDYVTYDAFNPDKRRGTSVFYFKGHITRGVYPVPKYNGAINAIETSTEISKFHLKSIQNNFSGNFIINFNNGQPSTEIQEEIEREIKEKFSGADNAGKFMTVFNDSKENALTVERIAEDSFDEKYQSLRTDTFKEIFIAFRAIPQLFGYSLEGTAFNKQEFIEAFELYNKTIVNPIQKDLTRTFNKIFNVDDSVTFLPFKLEGGE